MHSAACSLCRSFLACKDGTGFHQSALALFWDFPARVEFNRGTTGFLTQDPRGLHSRGKKKHSLSFARLVSSFAILKADITGNREHANEALIEFKP